MTEPDPPGGEVHPAPPRRNERAQPPAEFIDEYPGSYLAELGTRAASVVWGIVNAAGTAAVGFAADAARLGSRSEWFVVARFAWCILPLSSLILLILTAWQLGTAYTKKPPHRVILSALCSLASLSLWAWMTFGRDVLESRSLFLPGP